MPDSSGQSSPIPQSTPFQMDMTDDALVTFSPLPGGGLSFYEVGYLPVNDVTVGGTPLNHPPGHGNLFIRYTGNGVQFLNENGQPTTAVYSDLHYELVSYNGAGMFGRAADGTPTARGVGNPTVLAEGDLIPGPANQLTFAQNGEISGHVSTSFHGQTSGTLDISVHHFAGDTHSIAGGLTLDGGALLATFTPLSTG